MDEAMWAFGRVSGFTALALFTASILLGILNRSGRPLLALPRFSISILHRNIVLLATVFLGLHVGSLLLDSFAKLRPVDVVVPFLGSFRPFWQGLGTVALDLVVAVVVTALLRHRIGQREFKAVHWLSYAIWPLAMAHALGNGTDAGSKWFLALAALSAVAVASALVWRVSSSFLETSKAREGNLL